MKSVLFAAALVVAPLTAWAADLASHRAGYVVSLAQADFRSGVTDARGVFAMEYRDTCDGWVWEQAFDMTLSYSDQPDQHIRNRFATWESKDATRYRFFSRTSVNGQDVEDIAGVAERPEPDAAGTVTFDKPEGMELDLPADTLYPSQHTRAIIEAARTGEPRLWSVLFDGADMDQPLAVNTLIGRELPRNGAEVAELIADHAAWNVRMAVFPFANAVAPNYEMDIELVENGIVREMTVDYGDYSVRIRLDTLTPLPEAGC